VFTPFFISSTETILRFTPTDFYELIRGPSLAPFLSYTLILSMLISFEYGPDVRWIFFR